MSTPIKYGLHDGVLDLWLGDAAGPYIYTDKDLARLAAMIATKRLGNGARITALPIVEGPHRLRDEVTPKMSGAEALRRLEKGEV